MFGRKKKDDWWQQTGQEQNEASANADQAAPSTGKTPQPKPPRTQARRQAKRNTAGPGWMPPGIFWRS